MGLAADLAVSLALVGAVRCAGETSCTPGWQPWLVVGITLLVAILVGVAGGVWVYIGLILACGVGPLVGALSMDGLHSFLWAIGLPGLLIGLRMAWEERHPAPPPPPPGVLLEQFISYPAVESLVTGGDWAVARVLEAINEAGEALDGRPAVTLRVDVRPLDGAPAFRTKLRTNVAMDAMPHAGDRYLARYTPGVPRSTALLRPRLPDAPYDYVDDDFVARIRRSQRRVRAMDPFGRPLLIAGPVLLLAWIFVPIGPWPGAATLLAAVVLVSCVIRMPYYGGISNLARSTYEKPKVDVFALVASGRQGVALVLGAVPSVASDGTPMVLLRVRLEPPEQDGVPADAVEVERLMAMRPLNVPRLGERFPALYDGDRPDHFVLTSPTPLPPAVDPRAVDPRALETHAVDTPEPPVRIDRSELISRLDRLSVDRLSGELTEEEFTRAKADLLGEASYHL